MAVRTTRDQVAAQAAQVATLTETLTLVQHRYENGLASYLEVLDAQRTPLQRRAQPRPGSGAGIGQRRPTLQGAGRTVVGAGHRTPIAHRSNTVLATRRAGPAAGACALRGAAARRTDPGRHRPPRRRRVPASRRLRSLAVRPALPRALGDSGAGARPRPSRPHHGTTDRGRDPGPPCRILAVQRVRRHPLGVSLARPGPPRHRPRAAPRKPAPLRHPGVERRPAPRCRAGGARPGRRHRRPGARRANGPPRRQPPGPERRRPTRLPAARGHRRAHHHPGARAPPTERRARVRRAGVPA